ncbi:prepilin peptidase [Pantoea sp. DY-5]|uniref:prepilin peptidase n=1 Tax=Pantoea sp. DY-5 TaxID=2871488 RepID=UPI001C980E04|nr:prepilin peptidase [Pantoea sp. DY-5]MBY4841131.1 prepilin peptidase [Pantoea sp. DY-5]
MACLLRGAVCAAGVLRTHDGPPLTWPLLTPVALIYLLTASWLLALPPAVPVSAVLRSLLLLVLAVPLTLTDLRCQWLPLRYTMTFWLGGLASAALPDAVLPLSEALPVSIAAFALSGAVRWLASFRQREERMGLGDVYLMAGLCAWLPWRSACYAAAGGLLLCCLCAALTRQTSKPFAPALFGYLCGVCLFFPQQLAGVL